MNLEEFICLLERWGYSLTIIKIDDNKDNDIWQAIPTNELEDTRDH